MQELENDVRALRLAEQAIYKETLEAKDARLEELQTEVRYLRRLLNELLAVPKAQPQPQPQLKVAGPVPVQPARKEVPRRWQA